MSATSAVQVDHRIDGSGPPLYLIHGIGARKTAWDGVIATLAQHFTCVRYDLRGHGASPAPPPPYSLPQMVADLEALRRRLGHRQITVIGHSLGGMIAPAYARRHPTRVRAAVLISTAAGRNADDRARLRAIDQAMATRGVAPVVGEFVNRWFTDNFIATQPALIRTRTRQVLATPAAIFRSVFALYAETEMSPWLPQVRCPCLLITGKQDAGCNPSLNRHIAALLPDAELVVLDGLKHALLLEAPHQVAAEVQRFLLAR